MFRPQPLVHESAAGKIASGVASCEISPEAIADLQNLYDFISDDSQSAAERMLDELFDSFDQLAALPRSGHSRKDLTSRDVLFWPVQPYLVVYRDKGTMIQIVAVLHGARDIPSLLENR